MSGATHIPESINATCMPTFHWCFGVASQSLIPYTTHNTREINAWGVLAYYWCIKACLGVLDHSHSHGINARGMLTPPPPRC